METKKWFDRQFDLTLKANEFAAVYARLKQAPQVLKQITTGLSEEMLVDKPGDKWSIKEHAGHLSILERIWRIRFVDIKQSKPALTPADLDNKATTEAGFNKYTMDRLVEMFAEEREKTLVQLDSMTEEDMTKTSLHPRLQQPMRVIDLAYFVAEHDDHHFEHIREIAGVL